MKFDQDGFSRSPGVSASRLRKKIMKKSAGLGDNQPNY